MYKCDAVNGNTLQGKKQQMTMQEVANGKTIDTR